MAPREFDDRSDKELIESVWGMDPTHATAIAVDRLLRWRQGAREVEESKAMVAATIKLVTATQRLGTVTWWLVAGTFVLGIAAAVDVVWKMIIKGMHP